jgi:hypothetical protein
MEPRNRVLPCERQIGRSRLSVRNRTARFNELLEPMGSEKSKGKGLALRLRGILGVRNSAGNRQVAVQHPFRGDVSLLLPTPQAALKT